jgi:hypothetical protein
MWQIEMAFWDGGVFLSAYVGAWTCRAALCSCSFTYRFAFLDSWSKFRCLGSFSPRPLSDPANPTKLNHSFFTATNMSTFGSMSSMGPPPRPDGLPPHAPPVVPQFLPPFDVPNHKWDSPPTASSGKQADTKPSAPPYVPVSASEESLDSHHPCTLLSELGRGSFKLLKVREVQNLKE